MRLSQKEQREIKKILEEIFGGDIEIYIFGSRLDENRRGGDIDIFLQTTKPIVNKRAKRAKAKLLLEESLLKPVDIIIEEDANSIIKEQALRGVKL